MWIYKSCPKCHGDIFIEKEVDTSYVKCLQCGYEKELTRYSPDSRKNQHLVKDWLGRWQVAQGVQ